MTARIIPLGWPRADDSPSPMRRRTWLSQLLCLVQVWFLHAIPQRSDWRATPSPLD